MVVQRKIVPPCSLLKGSPAKAAENPTTEGDHTMIRSVAMVYANKIDHFFDMAPVEPVVRSVAVPNSDV